MKMTEQDGSGAEKNKAIKVTIDQVMAENLSLKQIVQDLDQTVKDLTSQLKAANDMLEAQARAKLIAEIKPRSRYSDEDLTKLSLDELSSIKVTLDNAKMPNYKNIHFGPLGIEEAKDEGLTVGDLSVVTEAKRKARSA
jgi:hypothetical protein